MIQHAFEEKFSALAAFLSTSREYLALNSIEPERAASSTASVPSERVLPKSSIATSEPEKQRKTMRHYRHLAHQMLLAAGLGAVLAAPAFAEPDCSPMAGHGFHHEHYAKQMEQHHKKLHDALKLTAEQEPGWKKLMDSEQLKPASGATPPEDWSKLSTPERADKMLEHFKARQAQMTEHVAALKAFYATLSAEQQKTFDDFHAAQRDGKRGKPGARMPGADKAPAKP
jgi:periplasmic protein CpxP/Spy